MKIFVALITLAAFLTAGVAFFQHEWLQAIYFMAMAIFFKLPWKGE